MARGGLIRAALGGALAWLEATRRWPGHPRRADVARAAWGPWPLAALLGGVVLALAAGTALSAVWQYVLAIPPLIFLAFVPSFIRDVLLAPASLLALLAAWRLRAVRRAPQLGDVQGNDLWVLAGVPLVLGLALVVVLTPALPVLTASVPVQEWVPARPAGQMEWSSELANGVRALAVGMLILAVFGSAANLPGAFGAFLGVLFTLWGIEMGLGLMATFARPFVSWLPWTGDGSGTRWLVRGVLYFGVAGFAWMRAETAWETWRPLGHAAAGPQEPPAPPEVPPPPPEIPPSPPPPPPPA